MSGGPESPKRRWRDDPLSVFLAFGAALLAVMYFLEEGDIAKLEEATARAQAIGARLSVEGCTAGSAGAHGTTLVFECDSDRQSAAAAIAAASPDVTSFDRVVVSGADGLLTCPAEPSAWPNGCEERPKPDPQPKEKAH